MDLLSPSPTPNSPLTPVFADNVQDLLGTGTLNVNPSAIITVNSLADAVDDLNSGVTTLRDAINQANGDTGSNLIVFDRSLFSTAQTITLSQGELDITHNLNIIAPRDTLTGGDLVTVSGNNSSRVFEIDSGATITLSGLIVADGQVTDDNGGGIKNSGALTLDSSIVRNSSALRINKVAFSDGGGIYNVGTITVNNSTIGGNSAGQGGGGIYNVGAITVNNSTISGNSAGQGGGIDNGDISNNTSTITVNNSTISGNSAFLGGGIYNTAISTVNNSTISSNSASFGGGIQNEAITGKNETITENSTINNSTISGNSAKEDGGGIDNVGTCTVNNSTISGNSAEEGGGIYDNNNEITMTINNSTIVGNSAEEGGGIYYFFGASTVNNSTISGNSAIKNGGGICNVDDGRVTIENSTISGNSTSGDGGGIYNDTNSIGRQLAVTNSTISDNSALNEGGGIYNSYRGTLTLVFSTLTKNLAANGGGVYLDNVTGVPSEFSGSNNVRNTIIAANLLSTDGINPDVSGTFTSNGYNLIGDGTGSTGFDATGDIVGTSLNPIDPRLAPLDFNGGSTQTIALLPDSPAIGAGDPTVLDTDPTTDQRGFPRRAADGSADIGAFEFSS